MAYPIQQVEYFDAGNALKTGLDAGAQYQRSQLLREEDEQRKAAAQFIAPALKGDVGAMGRLIGGDPQAARNVASVVGHLDAKKKAQAAEQAQFTIDTAAGLDGLPADQQQTIFEQRRQQAQARGWDTSLWPQTYNPAWGQFYKNQAIGYLERWKAEERMRLHLTPGAGTAQPDPYAPVGPGASAAPPGSGTSTAGLRPEIGGVVADARAVNPNLVLASGYRSPQQNAAAGGARNSQHMHGNAVDIPLSNLPPEQQQALVQRVLSDPRVTGFGYYPGTNSIHVDTRSGPRTAWGADQTTRTVGQGWPAWMMPLVGQWQGGGRRADAGGETPMPGQEPPVGAPQGFQRASYEPPQVAPAVRQNEPMRPENTVYNDGQGRAEPGGQVLGPQPQPDVVDPDIVQAQAQAPPTKAHPRSAVPQTYEELLQYIPPGWTLLKNAKTGVLAVDPETGKVVAQGPGPDGRPIRREFRIPTLKDAQDAAKEAAAAAKEEAAGKRANTEQANKLRDDFRGEPVVKAYRVVVPMMESARDAATRPTRAADLNLVYAFAKLMDPESVVRESETGMVVASGTVADRLAGILGQLNGAQTLQPETRRKLIDELESRFKSLNTSYEELAGAYGDIADANGVKRSHVILPIRKLPPPATAAEELEKIKKENGLK